MAKISGPWWAAALLVGTLMLTACQRSHPVYNVQDHPLPTSAQKLSLEEIEHSIVAAGAKRNWRFDSLGPGRLRATQIDGKYSAVVDISFTQRAYSIQFVSAPGLERSTGEVHGRYNMWIRNLEQDIDTRLYNLDVLKN